MPERYVLNMDEKIIHRWPSFEDCNVDDIDAQFREEVGEIRYKEALDQGFRECEKCFGQRLEEGEAKDHT